MPNTVFWADIINDTARGVAAGAWVPWLGLYTSDPRTGGLELFALGTAPEYTRQEVTFQASAGGVMVNSNEIVFPIAETGGYVLSHGGLSDAPAAGNLRKVLRIQAELSRRTIMVGRIVRFAPGTIVVRSTLLAA